ncbi:MAG: peptidoglycan-binding protein [Proteobacteria bacterium]|nr:peptidoglycan-binding protein [Pseudomonadota bacterium]
MTRRVSKQGSKGEQVKKIQSILKSLEIYDGPIDGLFSSATKESVVTFQRSKNVKPDGIVGPITWELLLSTNEKARTIIPFAVYRYRGPNESNQNRCTFIDEDTALWAARMCIGEGGKNRSKQKASAMMWSLMNRWMLHPARRHWPTYLYLMRRFSQPINPRWQKGGDLARRYEGTKYCTPAKLKRRAHISSLTWEQIPQRIAEVIRAFQAGTNPPPTKLFELDKPRISNWASHKNLAKKYPWGIQFENSKLPDWFFQDQNLIAGNVTIDHWDR